MMHRHRRRRAFQAGRDIRIVNYARQQLLQPRIFHPGDGRVYVRPELFDVTLGVRQEIAQLVFFFSGGNDLLEGQLFRSVIKLHSAANAYHVVALKRLRDRLEVVPHLRWNRARAVAQAQLEPRFSTARGNTDLFLADEEHRGDQLAVG